MNGTVLRSGLYRRVQEACPRLKPADRLIGVEGAPLPAVMPRDGSGGAFEIRWGQQAPLAGRQSTLQRMRRAFALRTVHASSINRGMEQHDNAEADHFAALRALLDIDAYRGTPQANTAAPNPLAPIANSIVYTGSDAPVTLGGGDAYLQVSNLEIQYTADLGAVEG